MKLTTIDYTITLLSDTCCSSGTGNGIDVDVAASFDECGLPIIPAKRLRGLLREQAMLISKDDCKDLFGESGVRSRLTVCDGRIKNADEIGSKLKNDGYSPREVAQVFTTKRYMTAIGENGVARDASLRAFETVKKGTVFFGSIEIENAKEKDVPLIINSFKLLRSIGMSKHRGLGEVRCEAKKRENKNIAVNIGNYVKSGEEYEMKYRVTLVSDVALMVNSPVTNLDYIPGGALQGAFAKHFCGKEYFDELFFSDLKFGNANISSYLPAPLSLVSVKNVNDKVYDLANGYEKESDKQYVSYGGYVKIFENNISRASVKRGTDYHINKGMTNKSDKTFFNMSVLRSGQKFGGSIFGTKGALDLIRSCGGEIKLGASLSAQYGKCKIEFDEPVCVKPSEFKKGDNVILTLLSSAIITDEYGTNSVLVDDLVSNFGSGFEKSNLIFATTETVGGFNAKWGLPKHQYIAFSKGTTVVLKCEEDMTLKTPFIGIQNCEGYGHFSVVKVDTKKGELTVADSQTESEKIYTPDKNWVEEAIEEKRAESATIEQALEDAEKLYRKYGQTVSHSAAMRILSLFQSLKKNNSDYLKKEYENEIQKGVFDKNGSLKALAEEISKRYDDNDGRYFEVYLRNLMGRYKETHKTEVNENKGGAADE